MQFRGWVDNPVIIEQNPIYLLGMCISSVWLNENCPVGLKELD